MPATTTTVFDDTFTGTTGPLLDHTTTGAGTWESAGAIGYAIGGGVQYANAATYDDDVIIDGSGNARLSATQFGGAYAHKIVKTDSDPDYAIEITGDFPILTGGEFVRLMLRSFAGASMIDHLGVVISNGEDTGEVYVYIEDYLNSAILYAEDYVYTSAAGSTGDSVILTLRVEVAGDWMRTLVDGNEVDRRQISALHTVNSDGDIYLVMKGDNTYPNLIYSVLVESYSDFWTEFVKTYEIA